MELAGVGGRGAGEWCQYRVSWCVSYPLVGSSSFRGVICSVRNKWKIPIVERSLDKKRKETGRITRWRNKPELSKVVLD